MKKLLLLLLIVCLFAACDRTKFPLANVEKPKNAPEYNQALDPNMPPGYPTPSLQGS